MLRFLHQKVQQQSSDPEMQLRAVTRMLMKLTNRQTGPKDSIATHLAGLCMMWLAESGVCDWPVRQLYNWILPFMKD